LEADRLKKNWTKIAIALGPAIVIASVVWEFARTNPDYNFVVTPWAMRGTEMVHGDVFAALGIFLLIAGLAASWERATKPLYSILIVAFIVIGGTVVTATYSDTTFNLTINPVLAGFLALVIAAAISISLRSQLGGRVALLKRALPTFVIFFVVVFGLFSATIMNTTLTTDSWIALLVVMLFSAAVALAIRPIDMAANRLLVVSVVAAWSVIVMSAGALRQTLIDAQMATVQTDGATGVAAQYKDVQAASGWWLAGFGLTVMFVGAVGLWAKRRDHVASVARTTKQRDAAEISAREIREAADAYAEELAASAN
jgi:hypothetical protein